jgi:hypothetical protein
MSNENSNIKKKKLFTSIPCYLKKKRKKKKKLTWKLKKEYLLFKSNLILKKK